LLVVGTRWSFRGKDAGSPRIDLRYGGDRGHSLGASGAPPTAQTGFRQALLRHAGLRRPLVRRNGERHVLDARPPAPCLGEELHELVDLVRKPYFDR
jgi:hypothetical protein